MATHNLFFCWLVGWLYSWLVVVHLHLVGLLLRRRFSDVSLQFRLVFYCIATLSHLFYLISVFLVMIARFIWLFYTIVEERMQVIWTRYNSIRLCEYASTHRGPTNLTAVGISKCGVKYCAMAVNGDVEVNILDFGRRTLNGGIVAKKRWKFVVEL